jgi:four helix bundle protein
MGRRGVLQDFLNLDVWTKAPAITLDVYRLTENFPKSEIFGLSGQVRRAASSIATNLAEGCGRTQPEFGRFVQIAFGSACEVEYQLLLSRDLGLLGAESDEDMNANVIEVKRILNSSLRRIQRDLGHSSTASAAGRASGKTLNESDLADGR